MIPLHRLAYVLIVPLVLVPVAAWFAVVSLWEMARELAEAWS